MAHEINALNDSPAPVILTVPGLCNSGPGHWQTLWEAQLPRCRRVDLGLWDDPHRNTWVNKLNLAIQRAEGPVVQDVPRALPAARDEFDLALVWQRA